ncbi:MAG TPA: zf-HC2 domain-containing protein [Candidatus Tumulicola sp.]|jgi:anti-sigma factor RsiW
MNQTHPTTEQLIDYVHGELPSAQDAAIHVHLAGCPECTTAHDAEVRLGEVLRAHARAETLEMPPGLVTAIRARTAAEASTRAWWQRLSTSMRAAVAVPIAAALALTLYFVTGGWHAPVNSGSADAAYYMENHAALSSNTPFGGGEALPTVLTADETQR